MHMSKEKTRRSNRKPSEETKPQQGPTIQLQNLSDTEIVLRLEALRRGIVLPDMPSLPAVVVASAPIRQVRASVPTGPKTDWSKVIHTCPKCGVKGPVSAIFGTRLARGIERRQSWCSDCRATTNYYRAERKNKTS